MVGSAEDNTFGVVDGIIPGSCVVDKPVGDGVGTADGIVRGGVVHCRAVGDREVSKDGALLGRSVVGEAEGLTVGINVGVVDGKGPGIGDGYILEIGVEIRWIRSRYCSC